MPPVDHVPSLEELIEIHEPTGPHALTAAGPAPGHVSMTSALPPEFWTMVMNEFGPILAAMIKFVADKYFVPHPSPAPTPPA